MREATAFNMTALLEQASVQALATQEDSAVHRCAQDVLDMLRNVTEPWAVRMIDATAKLPEPLQGGLLMHLGDYDGCLGIRKAPRETPTVDARYCLSKLSLAANNVTKRALDLQLGVCVPDTCGQKELDAVLRNATGGRASVPQGSCQTSGEGPPLYAATIVLGVLLSLAILCGLLTALHKNIPRVKRSQMSPIFTSLSPVTSWRKLSAAVDPSHPLACLSGLRVISIAWVVIGHRAVMLTTLPLLNSKELTESMNSWSNAFLPGGLFAVDTFLCLTGLVLAYHFLKKKEDFLKPKLIGLFYLHRYIRLAPLLAFVVLLYAGALPLLGRGPLWPQLETSQSANCRSNWWVTVLFIHNYYNNRAMCVGHSWYLAVDFQLYALSPVVLVPLARGHKFSLWLLGAVGIASAVIPFTIALVHHLPAVPNPLGDPVSFLAHTEELYIPTHTRASPFVIGMALGTWMVRKPSLVLSRCQAAGLWVFCALALLAPGFFSTALLRQGEDSTPPLEAAFFVALSKPVWAMGVCALVVLCAGGGGGPVASVLSWNPFAVLSRLTYAVYLIHPLVQAAFSWPARGPTVAEFFVMAPEAVADIAVSFAIALLASLLFESPFLALEKHLRNATDKEATLTKPTGSTSQAAGDAPGGESSQRSDPPTPPRGDVELTMEKVQVEPQSSNLVLPSKAVVIQVDPVP